MWLQVVEFCTLFRILTFREKLHQKMDYNKHFYDTENQQNLRGFAPLFSRWGEKLSCIKSQNIKFPSIEEEGK